jgi:hypothetical protein
MTTWVVKEDRLCSLLIFGLLEIKMIVTVIKLRWNKFWRNVFPWREKRSSNHSIRVNRARERSIGILQNRYGYTREQAIYQLDNYYSKAWLG